MFYKYCSVLWSSWVENHWVVERTCTWEQREIGFNFSSETYQKNEFLQIFQILWPPVMDLFVSSKYIKILTSPFCVYQSHKPSSSFIWFLTLPNWSDSHLYTMLCISYPEPVEIPLWKSYIMESLSFKSSNGFFNMQNMIQNLHNGPCDSLLMCWCKCPFSCYLF